MFSVVFSRYTVKAAVQNFNFLPLAVRVIKQKYYLIFTGKH